MIKLRFLCVYTAAVCLLCAPLHPTTTVFAQTSSPDEKVVAAESRQDLEIEIHLVLASTAPSDAHGSPALPASLGGVRKQISSMLAYDQLSLAGVSVHRSANGGSVTATGIFAQSLGTVENKSLPTFYNFQCQRVLLQQDGREPVVDMKTFRLGLRFPLVTVVDGKNAVQYENAGFDGSVALPLDRPQIITTISTGRPNEAIVVVATVHRIANTQ